MVWCNGNGYINHYPDFLGTGVHFEASGAYVWILDTLTFTKAHKLRVSDGQEVDYIQMSDIDSHLGICLEPDEDYFRVAHGSKRRIYKYNYTTHAKVSYIYTGLYGMKGIVWYNNYLYVVAGNTVRKIDPDDGTIITTFNLPDTQSNYFGLTHAGAYWYISINDGISYGQEIVKYDDSFNLISRCQISYPYSSFTLRGLGYDGEYIWYEDLSHRRLYRLAEIEPPPEVEKKKWCIHRVGIRFIRM